jgi:hypothetical protein
MEKKFGVFSSSDNPQKLGDTVKGAILASATTIIFFVDMACNYLHKCIALTQRDITDGAVALGGAVSGLWIFYGLVKKIIVSYATK